MKQPIDKLLRDPGYLSFPFSVHAGGSVTAGREPHVRQNIEQVLMTAPGERVFRSDFGAGVRSLVFEPGGSALEELTRKRLRASLIEALQGEVDPKTLQIDVEAQDDRLRISISYILATVGRRQTHEYTVGGSGG